MAFGTPENAAYVLALAAKSGETEDLLAILGPEAQEILTSGDPVTDRSSREVFVIAFEQHWSLLALDDGAKELIIGHEEWPFPIPLVKECDGWRFDTAAGKIEVLARRIGRNELAVIAISRIYVAAQKEYAGQSHDGEPAGLFAQKVQSTPGKHDGLYWQVASADEQPSPLGDLAAQAEAEGYSVEARAKPRPFHGYYFRILTSQGQDAIGGAKSYIVDGKMKEGFALIAYPAEYGNSGIMTFMVNQAGVLYESDLGKETFEVASTITQFNPDGNWRIVE